VIEVFASQMPSFLRGTYGNDDVNAALSWASGAVEAYCEREFDYRVNEVITIDPYPVKRSAQLPNPPVVAVTTLEAYMRDSTGSTSWQPLTNYRWLPEGLIYDTTGQPGTTIVEGPSWPSEPKSLRVTYTHGYLDTPPAVVSAVIKAAGTYLQNPFSNTRRRVGDVQIDWSPEHVGYLDENLLAPYRLIAVAR
jgi:hypothetical protein